MYNFKCLITVFLLFIFLLPGCKTGMKLGVTDFQGTSSGDHQGRTDPICLINQEHRGLSLNLLKSVREGNLMAVRYFLEKGADLNITDENNNTSLHIAAAKGYLRIVELILDHANNPFIIDKPGKKGWTALNLAVYYDHRDVVSLLLTRKANPNIPNESRYTPLHIAAEKGYLEIVKLILGHASDPFIIDKPGKKGWTALHLAVYNCHKELVSLFLRRGTDPNKVNEDNNTPLHIAAERGYLEIVELILDNHAKPANIEQPGKQGWTALHLAVNNSHEEVVEYLLMKGANPNIANEDKYTSLHLASSKGYLRIVELILNNPFNSVIIDKISEEGWTALHWAVYNSHKAVVKLLLNHGSNPNISNLDGNTAFDMAIEDEILDLKSILNHSIYPINFNAIDKNGFSLLHKIINYHCSDEKLFNAIISKGGVDINLKSKKGFTLLHAAAYLGRLSYLKILINHGADINIQDDDGNTFLHVLVSSEYAGYEYLTDVIKYIVYNLWPDNLSYILNQLTASISFKDKLSLIINNVTEINWGLINNQGKTVQDLIEEKASFDKILGKRKRSDNPDLYNDKQGGGDNKKAITE